MIIGSRLSSRWPFIYWLAKPYIIETVWDNTDTFHLVLLIRFASLINCRSNWLARRSGFSGSFGPWCLKLSGSARLLFLSDLSGLLCVDHIATFLCQHTFWHARWDPTIIMVNIDDNHFLKVPYEDLPSLDKDIIDKAIEEFRDKCLLSYSKNRDNKV